MKRLLIATTLLAGATVLFCALRAETVRLAQTAATRDEQTRARTVQLEKLRTQRDELLKQIRDQKHRVVEMESAAMDDLAGEFAANGLKNLSPEKTERLLAELGFNWNSPGNYLIVSKKSLSEISLNAVHNGHLTDAARAALALTPGEQAAIEAGLQRSSDEFKTWALAHAKREEPSGDVLAKYTLPSDPQFSQSISNAFVSMVFSTLGTERGDLLQRYVSDWMTSLGMFGADGSETGTASLTVSRQGDYLMYELRHASGSISSGVRSTQPFPESFRPLFPGGWKELADREGFELPPEPKKK